MDDNYFLLSRRISLLMARFQVPISDFYMQKSEVKLESHEA